MTATRKKASFVRLLALVAVLALVAAACTGGGSTETTAGGSDGTTGETTATTEGGGDTTPTTEGTTDTTAPAGGTMDTYTMGIFQDTTSDNYWNIGDSTGSTVWNAYVFDPTRASMYTLNYPGIEFVPSLAASELPAAVQEGDSWVAEVTLKDGLMWSDGEPLTASDVAFTWHAAVDAQLGGNWPDFVDTDIVTNVEAVDDTTVKVTFNAEPGLAIWGPATGVPSMPIMPEHFWGEVVTEALASESPADTLRGASGVGEPAAGSTVFVERQEGSFAATEANPNYFDMGSSVESGGVTYTEGPNAQNFQFTLYGGQDQAVLALGQGETDFLLNPLGMQRGLQDQVSGNADLTAIVNPTNGFRYMAFNLTRAPMNDLAFRQAISMVTDKEFVTQNVLQGVAFPVYTMIPEGNTSWFNESVSEEIKANQMAGATTAERVSAAVQVLKDAGYSWETEPTVEGDSVTSGTGLIGPDGNTIPRIEVITPTAAYDPLRAAFGTAISGFARQIGIDMVSIPTDFNTIIDQVYVPDDEGNLNFDMFILGWSLGNPALPTFHESFFASKNQTVVNDGNNNTGYDNADFDALVDQFNVATDQDTAYDLIWEMEKNLAENLPYITLFDTGILEFYNNRVSYPFTETLGGLQFINGSPSTVASS